MKFLAVVRTNDNGARFKELEDDTSLEQYIEEAKRRVNTVSICVYELQKSIALTKVWESLPA